MVRCAVKNCSTTSYGIAKEGLPLKLHAFPKDETRRKKWTVFCGISKSKNGPLFICSNHFSRNDYINVHDPDIKRRRLDRDAVPSIRWPPSDPANLSARSLRMQKKAHSELVSNLLKHSEVEDKNNNKIPQCMVDIIDRNPVLSEMNNINKGNLNQESSNAARYDCGSQKSSSETNTLDPVYRTERNIMTDISIEIIERNPVVNGKEDEVTDLCNLDYFTNASGSDNGQESNTLEMTSFDPGLHSSFLQDENDSSNFPSDPEFNMRLLCDAITVSTVSESSKCENQTSSVSTKSQFEKIFESMDPEHVRVSEPNRATVIRGTVKRLNSIIMHQRQTIRNLRLQLRERESKIRGLSTMIRQNGKCIENLKSDNAVLRKACEEMRNVPDCVIQNKIRAAFLNFFSLNQTNIMLGIKKKVIWTPQEICNAFSLRYHSQPAYEIVRTDMKIPLPCLRSLREWASSIDMRKGILDDVLKVLEIAGRNMERRQRVVILGYDEMSVCETIERDKRNDDIVGPHKEMQVISARGLFATWKQPIYVNFDQQISIIILNEVITRLHGIGFQVVGNVHDCGGGNLAVWKDIGVDHEKEITHMKHPVTDEDVYFFPDAPHLLKLIRNWLLDHGFYYKDKLITKKFLELLVEKASTLQKPLSKEAPQFRNVELNALFKLSVKHVKVAGAERQNVRLAAELLSHTTAVNLRRHFGEYEEAMLLAEIVEKVNLWFDVMNSYQMKQNIPSKKCYGLDLENQNQVLDDMAELMREMRTLQRQCLPPASHLQIFQKAVLVSIISTKKLLISMRTQYDVTFVMTYKVNQDFIENLYAIVRLSGGTHDHPTPLQALNRLRLIFLGKNMSQLKRNQNTQDNQIDEDYIMAKMLRNKKEWSNESQQISDKSSNVEDIGDDDEKIESWRYVPTERVLEEADGAEYVAGFIARGLKKNFPDLGNHTYELQNESENGLCSENYVQDLSHGGLIQPSDSWNNIYNQMDSFFDHIHNKSGPTTDEVGFRNTKNVEKRSVALLKKQFPGIPEKIIKSYANKRINIRVRHLKKRIEEAKIHKHKIAKNKKSKGKENNIENEFRKERSTVLRKNNKKIKHVTN